MEEMSITESFLRSVRKSEYDEAEAKQTALNESIASYNNYRKEQVTYVEPITRLKQARLNKFNAVLNECFCNLYVSSVIIDEPDKYAQSLRESATAEFNDLVKNCESTKDVFILFENAGAYIQEAMILAETITDDSVDETKLDIDPDDLITDEDKKLIDNFEKVQGKNDIAKEIQDRVVDVYKAEESDAQERKEQAQKLIDSLASNSGELNESVVVSGLNTFADTPLTLFNSIYMNRSKLAIKEGSLQESALDLESSQDQIIGETICMYTLLECIHGLGMKTIGYDEKEHLKFQLFSAR